MQQPLFLLKDTFKESVDDPDVFEKEFMKYLRENNIEFDNEYIRGSCRIWRSIT